jgi:hypothetical protein
MRLRKVTAEQRDDRCALSPSSTASRSRVPRREPALVYLRQMLGTLTFRGFPLLRPRRLAKRIGVTGRLAPEAVEVLLRVLAGAFPPRDSHRALRRLRVSAGRRPDGDAQRPASHGYLEWLEPTPHSARRAS